ncbi:MAG: glycoside hydrolase family 76 protein [Candidatus Sulfopaludibacter sp.]|nr:glycoside hydrolase family 76 protein [Candidatus Sulfopaludibacter sp.]
MRTALAILVGSLALGGQPEAQPHAANFLDEASLGIQTLQAWYNPATGLWITTGWWNSANATTVLVNYSRLRGSDQWKAAIENTFSVNAPKGFLNTYYDDEGWWALAWIDAYDWTGDSRYLSMAESIFSDMTGGWDDTCSGGIWWSRKRTYKNAIANELFLSVAARLANREVSTSQASYLSWANREWQWFQASSMINAQHLINDGLTGACQNNGQTTWTYNQGVILGGLAELSRQAPDPAIPETARAIAAAATTWLTDERGILHDACEPNCGADGVQFKGIFVRNLAELDQSFPMPGYARFLAANAESIWNRAQGPGYQFGQTWSGPFDATNAGVQASALDCIIAAAETQRKVRIPGNPPGR